MMEVISTSETSINLYQTTRRIIPEQGHLHTRHRENLKSNQQSVHLPAVRMFGTCCCIMVFCTVNFGQLYLFMILLCCVFPESCPHKVPYRLVQAVWWFPPRAEPGANVKQNFLCCRKLSTLELRRHSL
jgi:hypothetical protein